jgi:hypothetical protein
MILETFVANKVYSEYVDQVDDGKYKNSFFDYCADTCRNYLSSPYLIFGFLLSLTTGIVAYVLAWKCNAKEHIIYRVINSLLAMAFSDIYVVYYLIYRVLLKNKCY